MLKFFFHKPLGGVLFFSGLAIWFFLSAIEFQGKKEFKPDVKFANAKLFKLAFLTGAFFIIVGAILKIFHIQFSGWLICIGLIPTLIWQVLYTINVWK